MELYAAKFPFLSTILITCAPGLVEYVRREVEALGYRVGSCHNAGLELIGDQYDAMKLNLYLRTAYNVLFLLEQFECGSPDALYRQVRQWPWEQKVQATLPHNYKRQKHSL